MPVPIRTLAIASFCIGTTEFVIMGLLPEVAADLGRFHSICGPLAKAYALGVCSVRRLSPLRRLSLPRKPVLVGLAMLFVIGNFLCSQLYADGSAHLHGLWSPGSSADRTVDGLNRL